jgi:hypothetical protein
LYVKAEYTNPASTQTLKFFLSPKDKK